MISNDFLSILFEQFTHSAVDNWLVFSSNMLVGSFCTLAFHFKKQCGFIKWKVQPAAVKILSYVFLNRGVKIGKKTLGVFWVFFSVVIAF